MAERRRQVASPSEWSSTQEDYGSRTPKMIHFRRRIQSRVKTMLRCVSSGLGRYCFCAVLSRRRPSGGNQQTLFASSFFQYKNHNGYLVPYRLTSGMFSHELWDGRDMKEHGMSLLCLVPRLAETSIIFCCDKQIIDHPQRQVFPRVVARRLDAVKFKAEACLRLGMKLWRRGI